MDDPYCSDCGNPLSGEALKTATTYEECPYPTRAVVRGGPAILCAVCLSIHKEADEELRKRVSAALSGPPNPAFKQSTASDAVHRASDALRRDGDQGYAYPEESQGIVGVIHDEITFDVPAVPESAVKFAQDQIQKASLLPKVFEVLDIDIGVKLSNPDALRRLDLSRPPTKGNVRYRNLHVDREWFESMGVTFNPALPDISDLLDGEGAIVQEGEAIQYEQRVPIVDQDPLCKRGIAGCYCLAGFPYEKQCADCRDIEGRDPYSYCVCPPPEAEE